LGGNGLDCTIDVGLRIVGGGMRVM
jgi:hypothetical protein